MFLTCPVCGYDKINEAKLKWSICPSCGTQFGLSDNGRTYDELRQDWINNEGAAWQDTYIPEPLGWLASEQLWQSGLEVNAKEGRSVTAEVDLYEGSAVVWYGFVRDKTETFTLPRKQTIWPGEPIEASVSFRVSSLDELVRQARSSQPGDSKHFLKHAA